MEQKENKRINNIIAKGILLGVCLSVIIPFIVMSFYSRPCVDDYNYSSYVYHVIENGNWNVFTLLKAAIDVDKNFYNTWQGLYTSAFILALQPGIFGENVYFVGAIMLIILMVVSLYYFSKTVMRLCEADVSPWAFAFVGVSIVLIGLPEITEGLYWFNGAWNYIPFFFLTLVNMAWILNYVFRDSKWNIAYLIASVLISFTISGGNHVTSFLNILMLVVLVAAFIKRKWTTLFSLISALVGFYFMYSAPGTSIRQAAFEKQTIKATLVASIEELRSISNSYINIIWIVVAIMAIIVGGRIAKSGVLHLKTNPLFLFVISIVIECGLLCVPYYPMGNFGAGRVYNIFWLTYMLLSFINIAYLTIWTFGKGIELVGIQRVSIHLVATVLLLVLLIVPPTNYSTVKSELRSGIAQEYAEVCDSRYEQMRNANNGDVCYTKALPLSECLYFDDVTWNNDSYQNIGWREYYGVSMVVTE